MYSVGGCGMSVWCVSVWCVCGVNELCGVYVSMWCVCVCVRGVCVYLCGVCMSVCGVCVCVCVVCVCMCLCLCASEHLHWNTFENKRLVCRSGFCLSVWVGGGVGLRSTGLAVNPGTYRAILPAQVTVWLQTAFPV